MLGNGRGDLLAGQLLATRFLQHPDQIARRRTAPRVLPVPATQSPDNLLVFPILKLVAEPCQQAGFDFLALGGVEVGVQRQANVKSNPSPMIF